MKQEKISACIYRLRTRNSDRRMYIMIVLKRFLNPASDGQPLKGIGLVYPASEYNQLVVHDLHCEIVPLLVHIHHRPGPPLQGIEVKDLDSIKSVDLV